MAKILLVDDDVEFIELLSKLLELEGFEVDSACNGKVALDKINSTHDLILLDVMMPVLNGIDTLKELRKTSDTPVIMLTARGDEIDRILGLELGADDYLPKPFNDRELIARIKAILRRTVTDDENTKSRLATIEFNGLVLNVAHQQAFLEEKNLELTTTEFSLLYLLVINKSKILSREYLSLEVLGKPLSPFDRAIDMHMSNLRKKLPARAGGLPWFKTLRGKGYLLIT
ncbi:two-component system response regulator CpxR [Bisgaardia hudsonensis]|uniref:Two-component system response regulator CpxR n=1 Tax=Bisgaardia hudsonensis TaxID=109472 RepID=A0A4R2MT85_9PAST|nr:response regulator [Bisgaardia hudsonensis]QLB12332.1 DNA-binding response regulator [Bisgaardia hudsonensis]TCP12379.1 two-component system response regulator CpxR [Bisgaardia hudsonensis]